MKSLSALSEEQIFNRLNSLDNWLYEDGNLHRQVVFTNFIQACGFITQIALVAEKMNHHPLWQNCYKTLDFYLSTHDVNSVSELDFILAEKIDSLVNP